MANADRPSLDAVVLWLTPTIEHDYVRRGVFEAIRTANASVARANATLHYLTLDQAQELLIDADSRRLSAHKSLKTAFNAHAVKLRAAIEEARTRPAMWGSSKVVCLSRSSRYEQWRGTKEQFKTLGIALNGPYPGEPGGNKGWAITQDRRGFKVCLSRASTTWPGLYLAEIELPADGSDTAIGGNTEASNADERARRLGRLPDTADKFRDGVAKTFWMLAGATKAQMRPKDGYRFTDEAIELFMVAAYDAYLALKEGKTTGVSPRSALQAMRLSDARADSTLQRLLSTLRPGAAGEAADDLSR